MKCTMAQAVFAFAFVLASPAVLADQSNPLSKVISLMDELTAKVTKEGEAEAKAYSDYVEWCDETTANAGFAIDTATKEKAKLEASIAELSSQIETSASKIDDLGAAVAAA